MQRTADGTAYWTYGPDDGSPIVLIHGLGLNRECWEWTIPALSDRYRIITYDLYGHDESPVPPSTPSLSLFSRQLAALLDHLGIESASVAGFSLGGMIARRFAQDHPKRADTLAILHSPHRRSVDAQTAILKRVEQAKTEGPAATVEAALDRWFTESYRLAKPAMMDRVRGWVMANDKAVYHTIYRVLAEGVEEVVAPSPAISCPTLVVTGDEDFGNGPEMTHAIAGEIDGAETLILTGLRHMALAENPDAMNEPLRAFFDQHVNGHRSEKPSAPLSEADRRAIRDAFGCFATGVTIVTTRQDDGTPRGFTANSFTSVSLDPPLLLVCIAKQAHSCPVFTSADHFAVNVLSEDQKALSNLFASRAEDKFQQANWKSGFADMPIFADSLANFVCSRENVVDAGDHIVLLGQILDHTSQAGQPLGYLRGNYFSVGLEQELVEAASHGADIEVGALIEDDGRILLAVTDDDGFEVPKAPADTPSIDALAARFRGAGLTVEHDSLYAIYRDSSTGLHTIVYHGSADGVPPKGHRFVAIDELPFSRIRNAPERSMLERFANESKHGSFGIYHGDETRGTVHRVAAREPSKF